MPDMDAFLGKKNTTHWKRKDTDMVSFVDATLGAWVAAAGAGVQPT